ncbi:hypothetical protein Ct9H90mP29_16000 [bacterium]|nr:MAG: hypothetical protein Ct9H90mP29_16000 [bacterium]
MKKRSQHRSRMEFLKVELPKHENVLPKERVIKVN